MASKKKRKINWTLDEVILEVKKQLKKHPDCMVSTAKWDSCKDKPFSYSLILRAFGSWNKARKHFGITDYRKMNYSKDEVIREIKKQLKKHPDCMVSAVKWNSYKDRPFSYSPIIRTFGKWNKARTHFGITYYRKNYSKEEVIQEVKIQLKKHPDCMRSNRKWDLYKDKPFSYYPILRVFGSWNEARSYFGIIDYRKMNYSKEEVIQEAKKQLKKYPNCMKSVVKWNSYKDSPFSAGPILRVFSSWNEARSHFGITDYIKMDLSKEEVIQEVKKQLKKHPDCIMFMHKWNSYKDRPFSYYPILRTFGKWDKARTYFGLLSYPSPRAALRAICPCFYTLSCSEIKSILSLVKVNYMVTDKGFVDLLRKLKAQGMDLLSPKKISGKAKQKEALLTLYNIIFVYQKRRKYAETTLR